MPGERTSAAKRNYFTACVLAISTAAVGLMQPGEGTPRGLALVGLLGIVVVVAAYFSIARPSTEDRTSEPTSVPRLKRMALLWYAATIVLGVPLVKKPLQSVWSGRSDETEWLSWVLGALGLAAIGMALWKILRRGER